MQHPPTCGVSIGSSTPYTTLSVTSIACDTNISLGVVPGGSATVVFDATSSGSFAFNTCATEADTIIVHADMYFDTDNCGVGDEQSGPIAMVAGNSYAIEVFFFSGTRQGDIELAITCSAALAPTNITTDRRVAIHVYGSIYRWKS